MRKPFKESEIFEMMEKHLGVKFTFEDVRTKNESELKHQVEKMPIASEDFSKVPDEILKKLKKAAFFADMDEVEKLIDEIRKINTDLADNLSAMAYEFEYRRISDIISEGMENKES